MLFSSRIFSSAETGRRPMASPAVPMIVDSVNAPAMSPAAVPQS
jgi:hypothetical protein